MSRYTINHKPHGILIEGSVPLGDFGGIVLIGQENGYDLLDAAISGHFADQGVSMVMVNADSGNAWRKELGLEGAGTLKPPKKREEPPRGVPFMVDASQDDRSG